MEESSLGYLTIEEWRVLERLVGGLPLHLLLPSYGYSSSCGQVPFTLLPMAKVPSTPLPFHLLLSIYYSHHGKLPSLEVMCYHLLM